MSSVADYMNALAAEDCLGHGFSIKELVKSRWKDFRGKFRLPPEDLQGRMVLTLRLANILRSNWVALGGSGLLIKAAYRPRGGAKRSMHKQNAALDLDILPKDYDKTRLWYRMVVKLWCQAPESWKVGLGLYCRPGRFDGIRVHIDTRKRCRTWQHYKGKSVRHPAAYKIADDLGLDFPTRNA
jgi:hypothetical protein